MAEFDETGDGGALAGGSAAVTVIYNNSAVPSGIEADGTATVTAIYSINTTGGLLAGGLASPPAEYSIDASGGMLAGGKASVSLIRPTIVASGGMLVGGTSPFEFIAGFTASGGMVAGGTATVTQPIYNYPNLPGVTPNQVVVGGAAGLIIKHFINAGGGVATSGEAAIIVSYRYLPTGNSDDAPPDNAGVNVGYQNSLNPTIVRADIILDFGFSWRVNAYLTHDTTFLWNTGKLVQYWYRIIGKGKQNGCPPVDIHDPCCQRYILNIHASTIDDLCRKLQTRRWRWPIDTVRRFSTPFDRAAIAAGEAAGINYDCNDTVEVDVCKNALCADFCVDVDAVDYWGAYDVAQVNAFFNYAMSGDVSTGGIGEVTVVRNQFIITYTGSGGVVTSGDADYISSGYTFTGSEGVVVSGVAGVKSSAYTYVGGVYPYDTSNVDPTTATQFQSVDPNDVSWALTTRVFKSDNLYSICDVSYLQASAFLVANGFGFNIPTGLTIKGIEASIERHAVSVIRDLEVYLVVNNQIVSDNLANISVNWPVAVDSTVTYGDINNTWRDSSILGDWDVDDINDSTFGLAIRVKGFTNTSGVIASVDHIQLRIYYEDPVHQEARTGGVAKVVSSSYTYRDITGGVLISGSGISGMRASYRVKNIARGSVGPLFSSIDIGGQYEQNFHHEGVGGVVVDGDGISKSSFWSDVASGGVETGGEAAIKSSNWHWQAIGGLTLTSGTNIVNRATYIYNASGEIEIGGDYHTFKRYTYIVSGGVTTGGFAGVKSTAYNWTGTNGITIGGEAEYQFGDFGTLVSYLGMSVTVEDLLILFGTDDETDVLAVPDDTFTKCNCAGMPLTMPYSHNMFVNNKLSQFLKRNNIAVTSSGSMLYNRINDSWQINQHYRGFSANNTTKESWNIIHELVCTNVVGGEAIGENVWKLSSLIVLKDLVTLEEYDTRIVVAFLPDKVCKVDEQFRANISINTVLDFATMDPNATVYQTLVYDDIGLFKNSYWLDNPNIVFSVSQGGISPNAPRYPLNVGI